MLALALLLASGTVDMVYEAPPAGRARFRRPPDCSRDRGGDAAFQRARHVDATRVNVGPSRCIGVQAPVRISAANSAASAVLEHIEARVRS